MSRTREWEPLARRLADELAATGRLHDSRWAGAITAVPRHVLVPRFYRQAPPPEWVEVDVDSPDYLTSVYSNTTLVTALADLGAGVREAISSSSQPSLMVRMLESLHLTDNARVLEIGTGTGYNAGLLAHRLGEDRTYSIDVDPGLVQTADERLAALGIRPHLRAADGSRGWPQEAPFDAIMATCSVPSIPWPWVEQLAEGATLVADLKVQNTAGNLVHLTRDGDRAGGPFAHRYAGFMALRHHCADRSAHHRALALAAGDRAATSSTASRETTALVLPTEHQVAWFLAAQRMAVPVTFGYGLRTEEAPGRHRPTHLHLYGADGSSAHVTVTDHHHDVADAPHRVSEHGPRSLWSYVERAHSDWLAWGSPGWDRLGFTADIAARTQVVWLDEPGNPIVVVST